MADNFENLCRNKEGAVVLCGVVWRHSRNAWILSVYGYTGIKAKRTRMLVRTTANPYTPANETHTTLHNLAHLWAMKHGIGDFVFRDKLVNDFSALYHPRELTKENQS